jgi:hypothetical protein
MKPTWQVERALQLSDAGKNNCEIRRAPGGRRVMDRHVGPKR